MRWSVVALALLTLGCSSDSDDSASTSSGGSSTGGTTSSGGSAGFGGSSSSECTSASDCTLFNDCCACEAQASGEAEPDSSCPMASCLQSHCDAVQAGPEPQCVSGRCVLDVDCDLSSIACRQAEPECPEGEVPTAVDQCYGGCVPASECPNPP